MKLENKLCTPRQAKKLKKLGVSQFTEFYYSNFAGNPNTLCQRYENKIEVFFNKEVYDNGFFSQDYKQVETYAAFTAAELIVMNRGNGGIEENNGKFYRQTDGFGEDATPVFTYYDSFAQASAAKLIDSLQKEWVTAKEVNQRLQSA